MTNNPTEPAPYYCDKHVMFYEIACSFCKQEEKTVLLGSEPTMPSAPSGAQREKLAALPYDLVPYIELTEAYCRVAEFGAKKYAPWNWSKGLPRVQLLGSLLRHTFAYLRGEERDKETGLLHTDHILWNAVALCHNVHWNLEDDRRAEPEREYKGRQSVTSGLLSEKVRKDLMRSMSNDVSGHDD